MSYGGDEYYERTGGDSFIPSECKDALTFFNQFLKEKNVKELKVIYEEDFPKLTQKYFKASSWPKPEKVMQSITHDKVFIALYKDTYFRHIYSKLTPSIHIRFDSFQNYINLFNIFLVLDNVNPTLNLPITWLWDIIDEFVYQFRCFHEYRTTARDLNQEERRLLKDHVHVWSAQTVIRYLSAFVEKETHAKHQTSNVAPIFTMLAEFSVVALCQVMCLIGDYTSALHALEPINIHSTKTVFSQVLGCHSTLYYNMGFAYLMLRRYRDAIDVFSIFLLGRDQNTAYSDITQQKASQIRTLLAIALNLCPQNIDDSLLQSVQDKLGRENFERMSNGDANTFEEFFFNCCPQFISPYTPTYDDQDSAPISAMTMQWQLLREEIKQREKFPDTYHALKMCTSMGMKTLSNAMKIDSDSLSTQLLNIKHKTRNKRNRNLANNAGEWKTLHPPLSGDWLGEPQLNFYINGGMVFVGEKSKEKSCGDYFIRQTLHLEKLIDHVNMNVTFTPTLDNE